MTGSAADDQNWIELRVHGVSGTPPESSLRCDHVVQVAGDSRGRYFRPSDSFLKPQKAPDGHTLEAYHWGHYTAGSKLQGLWLLIIPFGLVNAAQFMLPRPDTSFAKVCHAVAGAALRAVSLALSCLLVFGVAQVSMDLLAWQWAGAGYDRHAFHLVWGCVPAVLTVFFFWTLGKSAGTGQLPSEDGTTTKVKPSKYVPDQGKPDTPLASENFFVGNAHANPSRLLHASAALAMVAMLIAWPGADDHVAKLIRAIAGGIWIAIGVVVLISGDLTESATVKLNGWREGAVGKVHATARYLAYGLFAAATLVLIWSAECAVRRDSGKLGPWPTGNHPTIKPGAMPGIDGVAFVLVTVCASALGLMLVATAVLAWRTHWGSPPVELPPNATDAQKADAQARRQAYRPYILGLTTPLIASVGTFVAVGYAAAFSLGAQQVSSFARSVAFTLLRYPTRPAAFVPPGILQRTAYAWGLTVGVIVAIVVAVLISKKVHGKKIVAATDAAFDFAGRTADQHMPAAERSSCAKATFTARLKNALPVIFMTFAVAGLIMTAFAAIEEYGDVTPPTALGWISATYKDHDVLFIDWIGIGALLLLGLGLFLLARNAFGSETARRGVNVVWDVVSFWPRSVHPLVPSAYSQFVVADLRRRISYLLDTNTGTRLVLAGHSQGSLISLTTLLWFDEGDRERIGLVTFGSQIRLMFSRAFPAYVNHHVVDYVFTQYDGRWCNLYRDTDPLAGPVLSWDHHSITVRDSKAATWTSPAQRVDADIAQGTGARRYPNEIRVLDPAVTDPQRMTSAPQLLQHSDYPADAEWDTATTIARGRSPG